MSYRPPYLGISKPPSFSGDNMIWGQPSPGKWMSKWRTLRRPIWFFIFHVFCWSTVCCASLSMHGASQASPKYGKSNRRSSRCIFQNRAHCKYQDNIKRHIMNLTTRNPTYAATRCAHVLFKTTDWGKIQICENKLFSSRYPDGQFWWPVLKEDW